MSRSTRDLKSIENEKTEKRDHQQDDEHKRDRPTTLSDDSLLRDVLKGKRKRIFITGEGGIGKTEYTRYLAWELSKPSSHIMPLWFELKRWKDTGDIYRLAAGSDSDTLEPLAKDKRVAFILDGLDELRYHFSDFSRDLHELIKRFPDCTFILAGRPGSLGDLYKHGFTKQSQHLIEPLRPADIDKYIRGYFGSVGSPEKGKELIAAIRSSGQIVRPLLRQPFMLAMTCRIHKSGKIKIDNRLNDPAGLVEEGLRGIFARRREDDTGSLEGPLKQLSEDKCLTSLSALAAHSIGAFYEIDRQKAIQVLQQHGGGTPENAEEQLDALTPHCGILIHTEERNYRFTNRVIAEFLAARWIVSQGYPDQPSVVTMQSNENPIDRSILVFLSDYIWSIRHRELTQAVRFELGRRKPELLIRFVQWLVATLPVQFKGHKDDLDLSRTIFVQTCRTLHACRNPSVSPTLLLQFQSVLYHFVPPRKFWELQNSLVDSILLMPDLLRAPYREQFILQLPARNCFEKSDDRAFHGSNLTSSEIIKMLASGFAGDNSVGKALLDQSRHHNNPYARESSIWSTSMALASNFAGDTNVGNGLLEELRACGDPATYGSVIGAFARALASGFSDNPKVSQALIEALGACRDPKLHGEAICGLASALASGFAGDWKVHQSLLEALEACRDPESHGEAIRGLASALASGFAGDEKVRQSLLEALEACRDPELHGKAIRGLASALASGFAGDEEVRHALLGALGACSDPDLHENTICGIASALASGFAGDWKVHQSLLEALEACRDPESHGEAIRGLASALASGFAGDEKVRQSLLEALEACRDPEQHEEAICGIASALASGFAGDGKVGQAPPTSGL